MARTLSPFKPVRKKQLADAIVANGSVRKTAKQFGISERNLHRMVHHDAEVKRLIEEQQAVFFESLPKATETVKYLIENYRKMDDEMHPVLSVAEKEHSFKATMEMLKGAGMLPSNGMSVIVNNVFNNVRQTVVSPIIQKLMDEHTKSIEMYSSTDEEGNPIFQGQEGEGRNDG